MIKDRIFYIDMLRIVSIIAVICVHVTSISINDMDINSTDYIVCSTLNSICRWGVPIFFMITGSLFLAKDKAINTSVFLKKNVFKLVMCIVFWGYLYSLLESFIYSEFSAKSFIIATCNTITGNTGYNLWFLYELVMIYLTILILKLIINNITEGQLKYILILWIILSLIINQLNQICQYIPQISSIKIGFELPVFSKYVGYLFLGYYLSNYELNNKLKKKLYFVTLISFLLMPILNGILTNVVNEKIMVFSMPDGIMTCFASAGIF